MNNKAIRIFTIIGIASVILRGASLVCTYFLSDYYYLTLSLDAAGQLLFLSMFLFIIKDLKENHDKGAWSIYLFICSTIIMYIVNIATTNSPGTIMFFQILFFVAVVIFISQILRTAYRLFGIVFIISIIFSALLRYMISVYLANINYKYWVFLGLIPVFYPLVLIYIVRNKSNSLFEDEINSIGSDIELEKKL